MKYLKCLMLFAHGGGRVVSASGLETSVSSSTTTSANIYDAHTFIILNVCLCKKKNITLLSFEALMRVKIKIKIEKAMLLYPLSIK